MIWFNTHYPMHIGHIINISMPIKLALMYVWTYLMCIHLALYTGKCLCERPLVFHAVSDFDSRKNIS